MIIQNALLLTGWLVSTVMSRNIASRISSAVPALSAVTLCALLLGSIMLRSTIFAQTASTAPFQLTLKDSIALALKQNIDVQVANINLAASQLDRKISRSALLPQASLRATDEVERYNLQGLIGVPIAGLPKNIGPVRCTVLNRVRNAHVRIKLLPYVLL